MGLPLAGAPLLLALSLLARRARAVRAASSCACVSARAGRHRQTESLLCSSLGASKQARAPVHAGACTLCMCSCRDSTTQTHLQGLCDVLDTLVIHTRQVSDQAGARCCAEDDLCISSRRWGTLNRPARPDLARLPPTTSRSVLGACSGCTQALQDLPLCCRRDQGGWTAMQEAAAGLCSPC